MAVAEDFTLANLVTLRRAAKGTRLTPEELQQTADLHRKIEDLQKQYDDLKASKSEAAPAKHSRIVQTLSDRADAARERLKARIQSGQVSAYRPNHSQGLRRNRRLSPCAWRRGWRGIDKGVRRED